MPAILTANLPYPLLFESNPQPMWIVDSANLRFIAVNAAAIAHYGFSRAEFLAMTIADIRPPEERPRLAGVLADLARDTAQARHEIGVWTHRCKDGRSIEVEISSTGLVLDGRAARLVLAHDVTQRRALERENQAARAHLQDVLTRVDDGFLALDAEQRCTYVNPRAARLLGRDNADGLLGRHPWSDSPQLAGSPFQHACAQAAATQQAGVVEVCPGADARWFEARLYPSPDGLSIYLTDISARKQVETQLRESEAYGRSLFEQLSDAVLLIDRQHRILDANPQALVMLGYARTELLALVADDLVPPAQRGRVAEEVQAVLGGSRHLAEWQIVRKDGSCFAAEANARALDDRRLLAVVRDITTRHASEQALLAFQFELSELTQRLLNQEKTTTQRVAQVLHDHLGQTLAVARLNLDACIATHAASMPAPLRQQSTRIAALLEQAVSEVRQVLTDLRPPLLEEQGLAAALDNEIRVRTIADGSADLLLETSDELAACRWPDDVEYGAFMVAREAIANAQQHAGASLIRVVLGGDADSLRLDVIDDGGGIPAPLMRGRPGHLGIVGMRERSIAIGARFGVDAEPDGGTRVSLCWEGRRP
ncbi:PAS domain S-box protein [Aquincola sp. S2]|uniref:histidine kinase n=1 Tax=Pseudaquabacterium terrae TaxID=2732868 RepID=A0ABX2ER05_9BURK|nr:PAS domain-containing sensor histidine kinase [Aquabacterium terrae]NRF71086.1 PAS domain S-box protein [Aquabacterium terrae]